MDSLGGQDFAVYRQSVLFSICGVLFNIYLKTVFGFTESRLLGAALSECAALWLSSSEEFPTFFPLAGGKNRADANGSVTNVLAGFLSCMRTPLQWAGLLDNCRLRFGWPCVITAFVLSGLCSWCWLQHQGSPLWLLTCCQAQAKYLNYPMLADKKTVFSLLVENVSPEELKPECAPSW